MQKLQIKISNHQAIITDTCLSNMINLIFTILMSFWIYKTNKVRKIPICLLKDKIILSITPVKSQLQAYINALFMTFQLEIILPLMIGLISRKLRSNSITIKDLKGIDKNKH